MASITTGLCPAERPPTTLASLVKLQHLALKIQRVCFSETLVSVYEYTRFHNPEEQRRKIYHR